MGFITRLWSGLLGAWIYIGERIFPPVIHPMLVHFPIVLLWTALLVDLLGRMMRSPDRFFDRASFWLTVLGFLAGVVAAAAGVISEQFVRWTPTTLALLTAHQRDAVLAGFFALAAIGSRMWARYPASSRRYHQWSFGLTGRGRPTGLYTLLLVGAVTMVTVTASLGGTMVYKYGAGVAHVTYHNPLPRHSKG
ncbi:MAG: hypothetical protein M0Z53_02295 [Thermaerobacter sp.]|nr:hypothetical protein [Thermaerobacter sp.]